MCKGCGKLMMCDSEDYEMQVRRTSVTGSAGMINTRKVKRCDICKISHRRMWMCYGMSECAGDV